MSLDFNIALSGLRAGEKMISVAQNNIANATNTSYARQRVDVSASEIPQNNAGVGAQMGTGAVVEGITRIRDELLIQQSRTETGYVGYYSASSDALSNIETIFNETGENSVSDLLNNFFNAFEEAGKFPEQSSYRLSAAYSGKMLAEKIRGISAEIDEVKSQTDTNLTTNVTKINQLLNQIANIHKKMETVTSQDPNALLDQRDKLLDELSQYVDVQVINKSNPMNMEIKVGNATLLSGKKVYDVDAMYVAEKDQWVLAASDVEFTPKSGSLAGILDARNNYIPKYEKGLNTLISGLIEKVNTEHSAGYGLDGTTGMRFFLGSDIRTIELNSELEIHPEKLALSSESGITGNSDVAKNISDLAKGEIIDGKTPGRYYQEYTVRLASDLNELKNNEVIHTDVQSGMESQRQAVQGVNTDDELADLMIYQKYYQSNAKTLNIVNDLMDKLLNIIG